MRSKAPALLLVLVVTGCGYNLGYTARGDISTVAVGIFSNKSYYRNIEIDITQAVVSEIEKTTPYRVSLSSEADTVLEGEIIGYRTAVLREDAQNEPIETEIILTVDARLTDGRTGEVLAEVTIREAEDFSGPAGEEEMTTRPALYRRIAREIVERLFEGDWGS